MSAADEAVDIAAALAWARARIDLMEARLLLRHVLRCPAARLVARPEQRLEAKVAGYGCLLDDAGVVLPSDEVTEARRKLPVIRVAKTQRLMPGHVIEAPEVLQALQLLKAHEDSALAHSMRIRRIDASRAAEIGLLDHLLPDDSFKVDLDAMLARLAAAPPQAVAVMKEGLELSTDVGLEAVLGFEEEMQPRLFLTDDCREGLDAFLENLRRRG